MTPIRMRTTANFNMDGSSGIGSDDYARSGERVTVAAHVDRPTLSSLRFRPGWLPTLAAMLLVPLFLAAGQWQWNKAAAKAERQEQLDARGSEPALWMPGEMVSAEAMRHRRVATRGYYEPQHQILIDNRTYRQQAGFHVVTPLRIEGSVGSEGKEMRVLVNRGWVPALAEHDREPEVATPAGIVEVAGVAVVPASRFFTLKDDGANRTWQRVWQNLDMERYAKSIAFPVQPVVIQLDAQSDAGGFVRDWPRPDDKRLMNLGYALQWWGFAATTVALWLYHGFRRKA